ncbi:hypothetical protein BJX61DRAFT_532486 [Aspergillus egyptiacus]|nr:hypothetical protein BJX61DRAFT_532486 [Aspergillus egyptiacus]
MNMMSQSVPKQTPEKKQISKREYDIRQEWAPDTIQDYEAPLNNSAPKPRQQQHPANIPIITGSVTVRGRVPNRREQPRSSSLFEEWKAKSLHGPVETTERPVTPPLTAQRKDRTGEHTASVEGRAPLKESPVKVSNTQNKDNQVKKLPGCQHAAGKVGSDTTESHTPALCFGTTPTPVTDSAETTRRKGGMRGRASNGQGDRGRQQHSRERARQEQVVYTAPNGTRMTVAELEMFSSGISPEGKDVVYFIPCFIEDPWKGMRPTPAVCPI